MTQTILRKVDPKERLPEKSGWYLTNLGNRQFDFLSRIFLRTYNDKVSFDITHWYEELEVPVAGVTDEGKEQTLSTELIIIALLSGYIRELKEGKDYEQTTYTLAAQISKLIDPKFAVTGNKPLKTDAIDFVEWIGDEEDQGYYYLRAFGKHAWVIGDYMTGNENELDRESLINKHGISTKQLYLEFLKSQSTPIDTLDKELFDPQICSICKINIDAIPTVAVDKEALLKQAKDNWEEAKQNIAHKRLYDLEYFKRSVLVNESLINEIFEEYLRLCTGGGEKE